MKYRQKNERRCGIKNLKNYLKRLYGINFGKVDSWLFWFVDRKCFFVY